MDHSLRLGLSAVQQDFDVRITYSRLSLQTWIAQEMIWEALKVRRGKRHVADFGSTSWFIIFFLAVPFLACVLTGQSHD